MRLPLTLFLILLVAALGQVLYYGPRLSDPVASSFDGAGNAHGFQSRAGFLATHLMVFGLVAVIFGATPVLIRVLPLSLVNVPHRDYYLAPERAAASLAFVGRHMMWMAVATTALLLFVMQFVMDANIAGGNRVPSTLMWAVLGPYFAFTIAWLVRLFARFRKPAAADAPAAAR